MGRLWAVVLISITLLPSQCCRGANPIYDVLTRRGVVVGPRETLRLPPPTIPDGLTAAQQRQALETVAEGAHTWEELTRKSVVAPFILKLSKDENEQALGRRADVWFVAYGNLSTLENGEWLERQFKSTGNETDPDFGAVVKVLTDSDLERHRLRANHRPDDEQFVFAEMTVLDRVRISFTTRGVKTQTPESVMSASVFDMHFNHDPQYPNRWRPVLRDENGRRSLGKSEPYSGCGSYVKATRLIEPAGAILVEYHVAFAEPEGWFNGTNLLRSKLPILAQMIVRQLRRELAKSH